LKTLYPPEGRSGPVCGRR